MGHRIAKHPARRTGQAVGTTNTANTNPVTNFILEMSTYYVLDAQGNVLSVYERSVNAIAQSVNYKQTERFIYGSDRVGVNNREVNLLGSAGSTPYSQTNWTHEIGKKSYSLSNHLGNVLSVISDKVIPHYNAGVVDYYMADVQQSTDYSGFGVQLKGRTLKKTGLADKYRFSFQNQESDNELKGEGNSVNYTFRMHDPRLGRFFVIDPLSERFVWNSPYSFSENRVIDSKELEGLEKFEVNKNYTSTNGSVSIKTTCAYVNFSANQQVVYSYNGGPSKIEANFHEHSLEFDFDMPTGRWAQKTWQNIAWANKEIKGEYLPSSQKGIVRTHRQSKTQNAKYANFSTVADVPDVHLWVKAYWDQEYDAFSVNYDTDKAITFSNNQAEVDKAITGLVNNPELNLELVGNTSKLGTTQYNQTLSENRANEAYDAFMVRAQQLLSPDQYVAIQDQVTKRGVGETNATGLDESDNASDRNTKFNFSFKAP